MALDTGKIAKNTTYYTASLVIQKVMSFIYFWYISSRLFPDSLGKYVFALSFTTLFSIVIDLGLSQILTREAARDDQKSNDYLKNILGLKIPLAVFTLALVILFINLSGKSEEVQLYVYLASAVMIMDSFTLSFYSIFRSRHNLLYESVGTVIFQVINFTVGVVGLKLTGNIEFLLIALICASAFNFIYSLFLLRIKLKYSLKPKWDRQTISHFLNLLPAFALAGIFVKIYNTSDSVLLGYLADEKAVGFYAVPAKVMYALQGIIPGAFSAVIYPAFSAYYVSSKEMLAKTFERAMSYLIIISMPMTFGLIALSDLIFKIVWPQYEQVGLTFKIMALALPFIFTAFATGSLLNACDRQKNNTINRGIITFASVLINIILIPFWGYFGAGIAFLVVNILLIILDLIYAGRIMDYNKANIIKLVFKSLIASLAMWLAIWALSASFHLIILVVFGVIIYFGLMMAMKAIDIQELINVRRLFKQN